MIEHMWNYSDRSVRDNSRDGRRLTRLRPVVSFLQIDTMGAWMYSSKEDAPCLCGVIFFHVGCVMIHCG